MNKQLKKVLFALLAAGCVLSAAACTETKAFTREEAEAQLDGFIVPESVTQEIGSEYAIPKVVVFDSDGGEHTPEVSAKCGDKTAEIVGGKLRLEKLQEYTLTYTLEYKGFTFEKVLRVSVTDTGKPIISVDGSTAKHRVNEEMTLPEYEVYDAGGIASETIEIYDPSDNKTSGAVDGKFMPSEARQIPHGNHRDGYIGKFRQRADVFLRFGRTCGIRRAGRFRGRAGRRFSFGGGTLFQA